MGTFHYTPQSRCADMAVQSTEVQFYVVSASNIISIGLYTPWPNRAEAAALCLFKATLHDLCAQIGTLPELKQVTVRELLRNTAAVRNSMETYGETKLMWNLFFLKKSLETL